MIRQTKNDNVRGGFTLVELLVVIGIIALLISVLLPVMNRAREQARSVACLSNLRQVAQWGLMYAQDSRGVLPTQSFGVTGSPPTQVVANDWTILSYTTWEVKAGPPLYKLFVPGATSGTVLHCPQAISAVAFRSNATGLCYSINQYLGGMRDFKVSTPNTKVARRPEVRMLKPTSFWFCDARVFASGGAWDFHAVVNLNYTENTPTGNWPWCWQNVVGNFRGHPNSSSNFVFGDGHAESIPSGTFEKMSQAERKIFIAYPSDMPGF